MDLFDIAPFGNPTLQDVSTTASQPQNVASGDRKRRPRGQLDMEKCERCRKDKKKCQPRERNPSQPCDRCRSMGAECSPNTRKKRRTDSTKPDLSRVEVAPAVIHSREPGSSPEENDVTVLRWTHEQLLDAISVLRLLKIRTSKVDQFLERTEQLFKGDDFEDAYGDSVDKDDRNIIQESRSDLRLFINRLLRFISDRLAELHKKQGHNLSGENAALLYARRQIILPEEEGTSLLFPDSNTDQFQLLEDLSSSNELGLASSALQHTKYWFSSFRDGDMIERFNAIYTGLLDKASKLPSDLVLDLPADVLNCPIYFEGWIWTDHGGRLDIQKLATQYDCSGSTILHNIVSYANYFPESAIKSVAKVIDINHQDFLGRTALHAALARDLSYSRLSESLINLGTDIALKTIFGHTPLHYAACLGNRDVCALLLELGASVTTQDIVYGTPLLYAVDHGHTDIVTLLLSRLDPNMTVGYKQVSCPLCRALENRREDIAIEIMRRLDWKRNLPFAMHYLSDPPLHLAVQAGCQQVVGMMIKEMGDEVNFKDWRGCSSLFLAVEKDDLAMVRLLLSHPFINAAVLCKETDYGRCPHRGKTLLHTAAEKGNLEIARMLAVRRDSGLFRKTSIPSGDGGETAFDIAVRKGHTEVAEMLERLMDRVEEEGF